MKNKESDYPFIKQSQEFIFLMESLLSKKRWCSLHIGKLHRIYSQGRDIQFYLMLVDDNAYLIDDSFDVKTYYLKDIKPHRENKLHAPYYLTLNGYQFKMDYYEIKKIDKYKTSLAKYEPSFLKRIDKIKKTLLKDPDIFTLMNNFLDSYIKDFYEIISNIYYLEDDILAENFCREKTYTYSIKDSVRKDISVNYQKFIDLLHKKEILDESEIGRYSTILLTRCFKEVSTYLFAIDFEESYKGYFPFVEDMDIEDCIHAYYSIDFIDKTSKSNISLFTYYLFAKNLSLQKLSENSLFKAFDLIKEKIFDFEKNKELYLFEHQLLNHKNAITRTTIFDNVSIQDVDLMSGIEFENFISVLFRRMGYTVHSTPKTGDQGIDIVAGKNGIRLGIQVKRYETTVSNKAIQEVVAGLKHYSLDKAIVITNNFFTKPAIELAISNDVVLWDRNILKEKIIELEINQDVSSQ